MVRLEEITRMVEKDLDDFYQDRDRFKGLKLFIDFSQDDYEHKAPEMKMNAPKFKKKLKASTFFKKNNKDRGLF